VRDYRGLRNRKQLLYIFIYQSTKRDYELSSKEILAS
jgi:hypothetical protein